MKAIYWDEASQGMTFDTSARFPAELVDECNTWREKMIEAAAEANEELMNKYLEVGTTSPSKRSRRRCASAPSPARSCR
jgi:elongation factor G